MGNHQTALSQFHPVLAAWFEKTIGHPTPVQDEAWPKIASGEHVLITAPTGSGKTFTAFLWAINQYIVGDKIPGQTGVLYISPLKALNNDIKRNLLEPLDELDRAFQQAGEAFPVIRVLTRSGDTPQSDRRRMQRHPPEILITTPESLNLLLSSAGGRSILTNISTVILDEIHSVVGSKRGVHLITAVDRLVRLSGEFQRIALSATLRPLETVAEYVGGYRITGSEFEPRYTPRSVSIVGSGGKSLEAKKYAIQVISPAGADSAMGQKPVWEPLVEAFKKIISANRSTLLFVNSRRLCEKLAFKINDGETRPIVYAHHGSLSREIRETVEQKFKAGELRGIIATSSLELGIDIGTLDEVLLIESPFSISSAIQKIGRAGHQVGEISRGKLFPTHPRSFIEAAALTRAIIDQDIEPIKPILCPLDVLSQIIISMTGVETWDIETLFNHVRTSYPYRKLEREQFDLVLNMLTGRYADSKIRELNPRISIDRIDNTVAAKKGALLALYMSGGTIPDRGYYRLRHYKTNAIIGELDEEFVWEARIGQTFNLGTQSWRIDRITHNDVVAFPGSPNVTAPPFWKAEAYNRDFHFSERIGSFLQYADQRLGYSDFAASLKQDSGMDAGAVQQLIDFLKRQKDETGVSLPHRHHLLVEFVRAGPGGAPGNQVVLHTLWGGRINRPFAMALEEAWEERYNHAIEVHASNDSVVLLLPHEVAASEILSLVTRSTVESLLRKHLEKTGFFGARFRECAGRALLLTKRKMTERVPLWLTRLQSKKLMDSVSQYDDFPILIETWRTCFHDEFDVDNLKTVLTDLESGSTGWTEIRMDSPSPMAQDESWQQINQYMYMDDTPQAGKTSMLRSDLLQDLVFTPDLRPAVPRDLAERFELKRRRLYQGYAPDTAQDLLDWVKERLAIPRDEWKALLSAIGSDHDLDPDDILEPISDKLLVLKQPNVPPLIVAREQAATIAQTLYGPSSGVRTESIRSHASDGIPHILHIPNTAGFPDGDPGEDGRGAKFTDLIGEWLQFYGPTTLTFIHRTLGIDPARLIPAIDDLVDTRKIITGRLIENGPEGDEYLCDSENYEVLLRIKRKESEPAFEPIDIGELPLFLASHQGITKPGNSPGSDIDGLFKCVEQLLCFSAPAELWETEIFPARLQPYDISWLDSTMQESDLIWIGSQNRRIAFCFESDLDLIQEETGPAKDNGDPEKAPDTETDTHASGRNDGEKSDDLLGMLRSVEGRYDFSTLLQRSSYGPAELTARLWTAVWQGSVTNDTLIALRRGIENQFKVAEKGQQNTRPPTRRRRFRSRTRFPKWKGALPSSGHWRIIPTPEAETDLLETEELKKERVRLLLDRYGILFRELLLKEMPALRWSRCFRSLRLMEFSGEVMTGCFFSGIPGPQFVSHEGLQRLGEHLPEDSIYWINATDPASLCGIPLEGIRGTLPKRVSGTHIVYRGSRIAVVSKRNGRSLSFDIPPNDPQMDTYLGFLHHLLTRQFKPLRYITVETINGVDAAPSEYVDSLRTRFEVNIDYKKVILYKKRR